MRLVIGICVAVAIVWLARLWSTYAGRGPVSVTDMLVVGLCVGLVAWGIRVWLRRRWRRRQLDTRGSALW
jgi:hypothetical protein